MKNGIKGYIAGILTCVMLLTVVFASSGVMREVFFGVQVSVNGEVQSFDEDMTPFIVDGRTFLPVRAIAEALGVDVDFDEETNTVLLMDEWYLFDFDDFDFPNFDIFEMLDDMIEELGETLGMEIDLDEFIGAFTGGLSFEALISAILSDIEEVEFVAGVPTRHELRNTTWTWDVMPMYTYTFNADGTGTRGMPGLIAHFEWSIPEAGVFMISTALAVESWDYTIENNVFTITSRQIPGLTYSYVLVD